MRKRRRTPPALASPVTFAMRGYVMREAFVSSGKPVVHGLIAGM